MKEFFLDILPSIVLVIIFVIVLNDFRNNKNLERNKRYSKESDDINKKVYKKVDYMSIGMWVGVEMSIFFIRKFGSIALTYGILCGLLVGKLVGVIVKRNF
ncbi:hypothetical protein AB8I94_001059 [Clostridium perfringens]|uniref:hypothetical protein n=1 Tax=Clostridium perfringens TaxID=1502 RepID=UPI000B02CD44|nr:hypothetical protein [Clostridium perfringens]MDU2655012.1 hypothetical protein [Clostridium perfringens]MDU7782490.1 hypothetical protein [Clostridium perfringens]MDU7897587.1 hypothetical protein [Clostridium perfringens]MDZ5045917.1 hypothetical protein [Clostridium perfringens]MDZ5051540.1 hypothetical protein [Clostridium perfringens]